ncbi:preprotein translocase subunit SecA, partial [Pseudonocardia sp. CNS-139]
MAKKTRDKASTGENPRRPCPCGSGKRFKVCHGAGDDVIVVRPFEGLAAECDLVAMREFLPSATAPLPLREPSDVAVTLATVLPGAAAALVRPDGSILLGMQVQTRSGDLSADLARALRWAQEAEPGTALPVVGPGVAGELVRMQDVLDPDGVLDLALHPDFGWWIPPAEDGSEPAPDVAASLERANAVIMPTEPVVATGVRAAYWVDTGTKAHVRWVRPEPE